MSQRRKGWDFAQLRTSFPADEEFIRLARRAPDDLHYLAAVGLWALGLAQAWRDDDPDVADLMRGFDASATPARALLEGVELLVDEGRIRGYAKHTEEVRSNREAEAERKRLARLASAPVRRTSPDTDLSGGQPGHPRSPRGVGRGNQREGESENGDVGPSNQPPREDATPAPPRANVTGFATIGSVIGGKA